jgi:hypothetical protein
MTLLAKRGERMPKHANAVMEDFIAFSSQRGIWRRAM